MKKKFYINSNIERFFSVAASLILILALNVILTNTLLKKVNAATHRHFINHCADVAEDYAAAVQNSLMNIESEMDILYARIAYKNNAPEEVQKILIEAKGLLSVRFNDLLFAYKDGMAYNISGERISISDRDYFQKIMQGVSKFYVSDVLESRHNGEPIIVFSRPVFDESHKIIGALCAACPLRSVAALFADIKIASGERIAVCDSNFKIIRHYDEKWMNWVYRPQKYVQKDFFETEKIDDAMETLSISGEPIYFFYKQVPNTSWQVGLSVPVAEFAHLERSQRDYQYFLFYITLAVLVGVFLLELWVHAVLERHQVLSTHIDSLTHLWARSYFEKEANKLLSRYPDAKFMLVETDIRGFKFINQNDGEAVANKTLLSYSKMLYERTKLYGGILSRGYADHFYVLIKVPSIHQAMHFFKKDLDAILEQIRTLEVQFAPKFGIAFAYPKKEETTPTVETLISRANFAKNSIKDNALKHFSIYDEKLLRKATMENSIEMHMESALENREFFVMYQPKVNLASDKVVGAEALVRWQSPALGFISPNEFIPVFEHNNFVIKLDFYVYEEVFKFIRACLDKNEPVVPISVNMSRNHNKPEKFVHDFIALLKKHDIPPSLVEVELLERSSMNKNLLRDITLMLQGEGLRVAMDDFGSGESSLNMLSTIPVNVLKFDRSFLFANNKPVELTESTSNFIETLVDLGKNLKKETIFEGVETVEQRDFLRSINCDQVQGYFYSKPLRESDYVDFLKKHI